MISLDQYYMKLAINEALKGKNEVYPNPRVGALVVSDKEIISSGYHSNYGGQHAEASAIKKLQSNISNATLYVTLEPCTHKGKTESCCDLITSKIFKRVVIGTTDPNPIAKGGIEKIKKKGIQVESNILKNECRKINRRFFTFHEKKRPYIILKIASSMDGFIAENNWNSKWITNEESRKSVHLLRSNCDAILVGRNTISKDNPILTSHGMGKNPKIVFFDQSKKIDSDSYVYKNNPIVLSGDDLTNDPKKNIAKLLKLLFDNSIQTLLVEGGGITFTHFFDGNFFDELQLYYAPKMIGNGISFYRNSKSLKNNFDLTLHKVEQFHNDIKLTYYKN